MKATVGFCIEITEIQGKWKLNQNHPIERRKRVIEGQEQEDRYDSGQIARLMRDQIKSNSAQPMAQSSQKGWISLKWKWMLLVAAIAIILCFFLYISPVFSLSLKPSEVDPDFPIPARAERVEKPQANKGWTFYEIRPSLTGKQFDRYLREIEKWGWNERKEEQMGRAHVFEKGGKRMMAVLYPDQISLLPASK